MESSNLLRPGQNVTAKSFLSQLVICTGVKLPTSVSMAVVSFLLGLYCLSALGLALMISYALQNIVAGETWSIVLTSIFLTTLLTCACLISIQPKELVRPSFKVCVLKKSLPLLTHEVLGSFCAIHPSNKYFH